MMRLKLLPKHVTHDCKLNYSFVLPSDQTNCKRKGSHSIDKYNPRMYLRKADLSESKTSKHEPTFYDYNIRVKTAASRPANNHCAEMPGKLSQLNPLDVSLESKQLKPNTSTVDERSLLPKVSDYSYCYPKTRGEFSNMKGFAEKHEEKSADNISVSEINKEKSRRKWRRLSKRPVFNFELDMVSNSVLMTRTTKPGVEEDGEEKVKVKVKSEGLNLSPHIQKKKSMHELQRRPSIKVYYGVGAESPVKNLGSVEGSGHDARNLVMKHKMRDNLKIGSKVKKFLKKGAIESAFDLNKIELLKIDPANYLALYFAIKKAVAPTFYSTGNEELNKNLA